jgi:hypothetical protein
VSQMQEPDRLPRSSHPIRGEGLDTRTVWLGAIARRGGVRNAAEALLCAHAPLAVAEDQPELSGRQRRNRANLKHHPQVVAYDPMLGDLALGEPVDVDVFDRETPARQGRNATERRPAVRARPCVVTHDEVPVCDKAQCLPGRVGHGPHHSLDSLAKDIEAVFGFAIGLVVRHVSVEEAVEVDRASRPLVVELLDDRLVLVRRQWSAPRTIWDSRPLDEPLAHAPLVRRVPEHLAAEERLLKQSRLRPRQPRLREYLHDLIRELPLFCWKHRRVAVPTQTSANVLVDPRFLTRDLIRESMQVPDLLEQRLKLFVGNRHDRPGVRPRLDKSFPTSPLVLEEQHGPKPTIVGSDVEDLVRELGRYRHRGHRAECFRCEDSFSTSGGAP